MVRPVTKTHNSSQEARRRLPAKAAPPTPNHSRGKQEQISRPATAASDRRRPAGKLGEVLTAVGAKPGATLAELVSMTGWQPHTARAALTRLRHRGFQVHLREAEGRKAYHLTQAARR